MSYAILSLVTTMLLLKIVDSCGICDPDVPSRPPPTDFMRQDARLKRGLATNVTKCEAGKFFNKASNQCELCPDGSFMTANMAEEGNRYQCEMCLVADESSMEVEVEPCTKTRDTVIMCKENYYRKRLPAAPNCCQFACTQCSTCGLAYELFLNFPAIPCSNYTDTICCHNMIVENGQCVTPPPTTLRNSEQSTVQYGETIFVKSPLVFLSFLLSIFIRSFSS
ncbi:unnamed protein product [Lymnaea stagnalis]|uniref:TNFR-Cys domain-containing protein n=1 Tax=Lymnaea stagnalis TaxID=6523 RepID=A0AAV2I2C9_LYMST